MTAVFEKILEMSLTSAVVIAVVLVIRLCLRKAPRKYSYALWSVAAFRLVCPVSFRAVFSLFQFTRRVGETQIMQSVANPVPTVSPGYFDSVSPGYFDSVPPGTGTPFEIDPDYMFTYPISTPPAAASIDWMQVAAIVWLIGLAALIIYGMVSYIRLRRRMDTAVLLEGNIRQSDRVQSPFILGFLRPQIYLPFGLSEDQRRYVLAHERYHIRRLDHIVRPLSYLILAVHWFNPLVWLAYYLMSRDMEMSCDEKVLSTEDNIRRAYSTTLLSFAANRRFPSPSPLAFGESGVKGRIKNALNWKKPSTWVTIAAIVVCIVVIVICAADPKEPEGEPEAPYEWTSTVTGEAWSDVIYYVVGEGQDRFMTVAQRQELAELLNGITQDGMKYRDSDDGYVNGALHIDFVDGSHFVKYLPDGSLILSVLEREGYGAGEYVCWEVDSDELKAFLDELRQYREPDPVDLSDYRPYVSVKCIYMNPLSSYVGTNDSGKSYMIGGSMVAIFDKRDNDAGIIFETLPDWRPLTEEEWAEMFEVKATTVDISGYENPMILELSDEYQLVSVDGTLWMVHCLSSSGIWDIYQLAVADQTATLAQWQVDLTGDGVDDTITVKGTIAEGVGRYVGAALTVTDADGNRLWSDGFSVGSDEEADFYLVEQNGGYAIMNWSFVASEAVLSYNYSIIPLDGTSAGIRYNSLRCGLSDEELLALDLDAVGTYFDTVQALMENGTLLLGGIGGGGNLRYSTPEEPFTFVWASPLEELKQARQEIEARKLAQMEALAVWQADLTHDGVEETITVGLVEETYSYPIVVQDRDGNILWCEEAYGWAKENRGYYLCRQGGKTYLLRWCPTARQSWYNYSYELFSLTASGEEVSVAGRQMKFDGRYDDEILAIDVETLRTIETEVIALLKHSTVLLDDTGEEFILGDPSAPVTPKWEPQAEMWEQEQKDILAQRAEQTANILAVWPLNDLTVTVLKTEDENVYTLDVYGNDYFFWSTELHTQPGYGDTFYLLYRENGKEYLAEFTGSSRQGIGTYSYRVFTVRPESLDILYENSLYYEAVSEEDVLTVDLDAIRAFENEVNNLFYRNANVICGVSDGQMFWYPGGSDLVFRWCSEADELEKQRQAILDEMPLVVNNKAPNEESVT